MLLYLTLDVCALSAFGASFSGCVLRFPIVCVFVTSFPVDRVERSRRKNKVPPTTKIHNWCTHLYKLDEHDTHDTQHTFYAALNTQRKTDEPHLCRECPPLCLLVHDPTQTKVTKHTTTRTQTWCMLLRSGAISPFFGGVRWQSARYCIVQSLSICGNVVDCLCVDMSCVVAVGMCFLVLS